MSKQTNDILHKTTIGGQSILEGIVMKGPRMSSTVVRRPDGGLQIRDKETTPLRERNAFFRLPVVRGFCTMVQALAEGFEAIEYSSQFLEEDIEPSKFETWLERTFGAARVDKAIYVISLVLGLVIAVGLFILLPAVAVDVLPERVPQWGVNLLEGILRIVIFIAYMALMAKFGDIERTFRYHGAEHKTIYCYEKQMELTVENVRIQPREHPRCGTSFLFVVMIISILVFSLVTAQSKLLRLVLRIVLLPVVIGVSYEVNRIAGRHENILCRALRWPGLMLQHITVLEPDDSMIEVAITALKHVIPDNPEEDTW